MRSDSKKAHTCFFRSLIVLVFILFAPGMRVYANPNDCIGTSSDGAAICTKPIPGSYSLGACINNALSTTEHASDWCATEVGLAGSVADEGLIASWIECLPVRQSGACHVDPVQINWLPYGTVNNSYGNLCWNFTVNDNSGFAIVHPTAMYPSNGQCTQPGGYYDVIVRKDRPVTCPKGYNSRNDANGNVECWRRGELPSCKARQPASEKCGNPMEPITGRKIQTETDYAARTASPLEFARTYNSFGYFRPITGQDPGVPAFGEQWTHTYQQRVFAITGSATAMAVVQRSDGSVVYFKTDGTQLLNTGPSDLLTTTATGWRLTTTSGTVEDYGSDGQLLSVNDKGKLVTLLYSDASTPTTIAPGPGYLIKASDAFGHNLQFRYGTAGRMLAMKDPAGLETVYEFNGPSAITPWGDPIVTRLTKVTYPDTTSRTYYYNEQTYTFGSNVYSALTGIVDESGTRFASWSYNGGNVMRSEHANGVERTTLNYGTNAVGVQQANGQTISYNWTSINDVIRVTSKNYPCDYWAGNCPTTEYFAYDPATGDMTSRTDPKGVQTTFSFDPIRHLEISRTEAAGTPRTRTIGTQWHPTLSLPAQIDSPGRRETYTYDANGNVLTRTITDLTVTPNVSRTTNYTYINGRVLTIDGPRTDIADITTYSYYSCSTGNQCGQVETITNPLGQVTTFDTYNAYGQPLTITDANGVVATRTYDLKGRLTTNTIGTEQTVFDYWPTGLLKKLTTPDGSFLQYVYDDAHRLTSITDGLGSHITYTLDAMSNRTAAETYDPSNAVARVHTWAFNYVNQLHYEYGPTLPSGVATFYGYDRNGNQTSISAPLNRNTSQAYDELNRLSSVTDAAWGVTSYGYDALDQLTSLTDPKGLVTNYTYDGLGDLKQQVSPDTGSTTNTYDSGGNIKTSTDARGAITTYTYDTINRVSKVAFKKGSTTDQTITYNYDQGTNGVGRLTSVSDSSHSMNWAYDSQGRVLNKSQSLGTLTKTVSYSYTAGQLTTMTTPSGQVVTYGYTNGQVTSIVINGMILLSDVLYDPFGPVRQWTWGNGTLAVRTYDQDGKVSQIDSAGLNTYAYDDAFRITGVTDTTNSALSWTYGYDTLDRLNSASKAGTTIGFTYGADSNRLTQTGNSAQALSYPTTSNKLTSISGALTRTYSYDAAGNTTAYGTNTFVYNNRGRMKSVTNGGTTTTYTYNALGQRVKKVNSTTRFFIYDEAGHLLGEYNSATPANILQETIWLGDIPVATIRPKTGGVDVFYVHSDHLNTPRKITRPSDNKLRWRWDPDPFGNGTPDENPQSLGAFNYGLRFPGQYSDMETGLNYNYARDYDPATGTYMQSDPTGLEAGLNTYSYADGNPLSYIDPLGLDATAPAIPRPAPFPAVRPIPGWIRLPSPWWFLIYPSPLDDSDLGDQSRADNEPKFPPVNPGRDCNGKCNPCPPGREWTVDSPGHGHPGGFRHKIVYNQDPVTCMCYPDRPSRGLQGK